MVDLDVLMNELKEISDEYAVEMGSDDDWTPMVFVIKDDKRTMISFEIPSDYEKRDKLFTTVLPNLIHQKFDNPDAIIFLSSAWYKVGFDISGPPPSQLPDRKEALMLQGISKDEEKMIIADIIRSESHPELDWDIDMNGSQFAGRIMAFLRRAVWS